MRPAWTRLYRYQYGVGTMVDQLEVPLLVRFIYIFMILAREFLEQ
jgi:hypothetical protein